ncbi:MAG: CHAT domain-containing protein [Chitinophagaceae bacterium]|nr:CHAT domain-containing protein [Chitinophagaceae bacterium]
MEYEKAIPVAKNIIEEYRKSVGENHSYFSISLCNLANLYADLGQFDKAEPIYLKSLGIQKKIIGDNYDDYAYVMSQLGMLYYDKGQFDKAEPLNILIIEMQEKRFGKLHPQYASAIHDLARLYWRTGRYEKSKALYVEENTINKSLYGEISKEYTNGLNGLALVYQSLGQYEKAEPMLLLINDIKKKIFGENHIQYATSLYNLASLYGMIGQYEKAEPMFLRARNIFKSVLGAFHQEYGNCVMGIAGLYESMNRYKEAERFYMEAKDIFKKSLGQMNWRYTVCLNNLAYLYEKKELYEKAMLLIVEAKGIQEKEVGINNERYGTIVSNLSRIYERIGQYENALNLRLQVNDIWKNKLGDVHPDYIKSLSYLALLYSTLNQPEKALPLFLTINSANSKNTSILFSILSEREKGSYINNNISDINNCNSFLYKYQNRFNGLQKSSYDLLLYYKSLALSDTRNIITAVENISDSSLRNLLQNWQKNKSLLAREYSLPVITRRSDLSFLENEAQLQEKKLNNEVSSFSKISKEGQVRVSSIRENLKNEEVAIEFVRFNLYNKKWTDSIMYAAYILKKNDSIPLFVPLCEEKQLQQIFDSAGTIATTMVNSFYRGIELGNTSNSSFLGNELYKLIWEPLEPYLKGIKKVSYSPAGKLFSVAFQALPIDSNKVLMDKYDLQQYTSTRQVALRTEDEQKIKPTSITLFGNASFTMDSLQLVKQRTTNETNSNTLYTPKKRGDDNGSWENLPGTAEEVKKIKQLFDENKINTKTFIQTTASEENLKALSGNSPQLLHIATHGFFLPDPEKKKSEMNFGNENAYTLANDPLLRSGLILAGGNYAWSGKTPIEGVEDGIATAYEISQLNLSNTELVVLSACETALGDVKGSEGVFGLQRAFKMAGVKKMIVSLWQVPDKETAELMTAFYTYWMKGKTIEESFGQAQADMRKKYSPFYWAAFVLVE